VKPGRKRKRAREPFTKGSHHVAQQAPLSVCSEERKAGNERGEYTRWEKEKTLNEKTRALPGK